MVWDGDLLLFTDATGIYISWIPTKNTATARGRNLTVVVMFKWRISSLNHVQLSVTAYVSLSKTPYKLQGCCPEADPDPWPPRRESKEKNVSFCKSVVLVWCLVWTWTVWVFHVLIFSMPAGNILDSRQIYGLCDCGVCSNNSYLHRGTVFYGKCSRGVMFVEITECSFDHKQTNIVTVIQS